jgi:hypothetical protein
MDKMNFASALGAAALLAITPMSLAGSPDADSARIVAGEAVVAFEMYWPERSAQEIATRTGALASLITGERVHTDDVRAAISRSEAGARTSEESLSGAPGLAFTYLPEFDEIRLSHLEALATSDPGKDIGETEAIAEARIALQAMAEAGIIEKQDYAKSQPQVGYRKVAGGTIEGVTDFNHVVEYRVTFRPQINGIELANAGARIGVHANGGISSLRVGGVTVAREKRGEASLPSSKGEIYERKVTASSIRERFRANQPDAAETRIAFEKLMYVMPDDTRRAVIAPTQVFSYSLAFAAQDGQQVVSRRQIVGFDVTDSRAAMINYTPAARDSGDEPKRQR